mgnify:FL=1
MYVITASSAALSLAVIGGTLAGLPARSLDLSVILVVLDKLLLHPLAVGLGLLVMAALGFGTGDPELAGAAVIMAATPAMGIYPILAQRYDLEQGAALAMFAMTLLSFPTMTAVLAIMLP